ncbi:hypothetical protein GCM10020331_063630 [Ectobacillus funiculus]
MSRITDGEWLEADESDLTLLANAQAANSILKKLKKMTKTGINKLDLEKNSNLSIILNVLELKTNRTEIINGLLDVYNDYRELYHTFQDEEYKNCDGFGSQLLNKTNQKKK